MNPDGADTVLTCTNDEFGHGVYYNTISEPVEAAMFLSALPCN